MQTLACYNFKCAAPFCACNISKCLLWDALHFLPVCHVCLSSSWCPNHWCKSAIKCSLQLLIRLRWFVIFVAFDVCILWAWSLHEFWSTTCHLYGGACLVFLWSMWWLAQACKVASVMLLICDLVISAKSESVIFCCHVNLLSLWVLYIIWRCSLRIFCFTCYALFIHALFCIYSLL